MRTDISVEELADTSKHVDAIRIAPNVVLGIFVFDIIDGIVESFQLISQFQAIFDRNVYVSSAVKQDYRNVQFLGTP